MNNIASQPLDQIVADWLRDCFRKAFPEAGAIAVDVVRAAAAEFGDYQCNDAMALAKILKRKPRDIAQTVIEAVPRPPMIADAGVAGPGFINLRIDTAWLAEHVMAQSSAPNCGVPPVGAGKTVIIDYSGPNVAKPMHIGHIRSTVIGNALDRIYRNLGYRVIADNHLGDWGTQFGILIKGYRNFLDSAAMERAPIEELERLYVESHKRGKESEEWLVGARQELVKLQGGDPENTALWREFIALSLREFEKIYRRLNVAFDLVRGESYYRDDLAPLLARLQQNGLVRPSEGAQVAFLEEEKLPPCIIQKSDGAFNYAATDVATVLRRIAEFAPDRIVYVTDERQQLHFRQVFAICRRLGVRHNLVHVWFGLMRLPQGTFSTRDGNVIKLEHLLDEAEARALAIVQTTSPDMDSALQREVARAVGIGAVKYADLSQNPQSLVTFSWEKALALDGNSAPYLQYACARIASVLEKYRERFQDCDPETAPLKPDLPIERDLILHLARFTETLIRAAESYKPSVLADYLYELAGIYSTFYQNVPFLKSAPGIRESRVKLCGMTVRILRHGLSLLGIQAPERI